MMKFDACSLMGLSARGLPVLPIQDLEKGADRTTIPTRTTEGTNWTADGYRVKVLRKTADGTIEVYRDDLKIPVQTATVRTIQNGRVGRASFDDPRQFDHVVVRGAQIAEK